MRTFFYFSVFFCAMFVSMLAKRAAPPAFARSARPSFARTFFSRANSAKDHSSSGQNGQFPADSAAGPAAPPLAAYNYDKASFDRLVTCEVAVAFAAKARGDSNVFRRSKKPAQLLPSGEDNLFVTGDRNGHVAFGVADGVGGWAEAGYDSSAISRELCRELRRLFEATVEKTPSTPKQMLTEAFAHVLSLPQVEIGGTTACVGVLTPERKLQVANLGDSWCGVFREGTLVKETQFQTHNFNTPFQLAKVPAQILRQAELQGKKYIMDTPEMCDEYVWQLQKDDVVVFATDGVTDNVVPQDMELFLKDRMDGKSLADVATELVHEVVKVSKDPNFPSAFAQELLRLTGQRYLGGKEDDVTVVMVKVL